MQKSKRGFEILYKENLSPEKNINNNKIRLLIITNIENINYIKFMLTLNINETTTSKFYNINL